MSLNPSMKNFKVNQQIFEHIHGNERKRRGNCSWIFPFFSLFLHFPTKSANFHDFLVNIFWRNKNFYLKRRRKKKLIIFYDVICEASCILSGLLIRGAENENTWGLKGGHKNRIRLKCKHLTVYIEFVFLFFFNFVEVNLTVYKSKSKKKFWISNWKVFKKKIQPEEEEEEQRTEDFAEQNQQNYSMEVWNEKISVEKLN